MSTHLAQVDLEDVLASLQVGDQLIVAGRVAHEAEAVAPLLAEVVGRGRAHLPRAVGDVRELPLQLLDARRPDVQQLRVLEHFGVEVGLVLFHLALDETHLMGKVNGQIVIT